jgi:gas vesicle protein
LAYLAVYSNKREVKMNKDTGGRFFAGLILGAIIGAAVGLLYAPKPGTETRRLLKEKALSIKEKVSTGGINTRLAD